MLTYGQGKRALLKGAFSVPFSVPGPGVSPYISQHMKPYYKYKQNCLHFMVGCIPLFGILLFPGYYNSPATVQFLELQHQLFIITQNKFGQHINKTLAFPINNGIWHFMFVNDH